MEKFTHHDCRHVYATWRVLAGHHADKVSLELGESSESKMLRDVYSQVTSEHILPPDRSRPLLHGQEWKRLRTQDDLMESGQPDQHVIEGPVQVGESPQVLAQV